jgi:hypothetical protein
LLVEIAVGEELDTFEGLHLVACGRGLASHPV